MALTLTSDERAELQRRVRSLKIRAEDARRARVILMLADGDSYSTIESAIPCYRDYINRWRRRFVADRLDGLRARYRGGSPTVLTPKMEARILRRRGTRRPTAARIGVPANARGCSTFITTWSRRRGGVPACNRIASSGTCSRTIPTLKRRPST